MIERLINISILKRGLLLGGLLCLLANVALAIRPTTHSSNLTYNNLNCGSVKINWTSGDGAARVIIVKEGTIPDYTPVDGEEFTADPIFGNSQEYPSTGGGNFIVYNANGTNFVTVTNLKPGKNYCFTIWEHDNNGSSTQYIRVASPPTICVTTLDIRLDFTFKVLDSCQMTNSFEFTNTSSSTISGISYMFDFGDGTSTNSPVTHKFSQAGFRAVKIIPITSITGCPTSFTRNVKIFQKKTAYINTNLFEDTQCLDDNYFEVQSLPLTQFFPSGATYRWFYGDGDSSTFPRMKKRYKISGTFRVQLELTTTSYAVPTACKDTLFFDITVLPSPVGNISINDTFQCLKHNAFEFKNPDNTLTFFKWYFGDNDSSDNQNSSHVYTDTGTYRVMHIAYAKSGCKGRDTLDIKVLPNLDSRFGGLDTFYCQSQVADIIQPNVQGGSFFGYPINNYNMRPNTVGSFTVSHVIKDQYCSDTSSASFRVAPTPDPQIGNDTAVCNALSFSLNANTFGTFSWSTGETTQSINAINTGKYTVTATQDKCSDTDSINLVFSTPPRINIGGDTILCKGGGLWMNAAYPRSTYLWNTGSTDSVLYAFQPGKYLVTVTNPCGTVQDSVFIYYQTDYCDLFMANAFSPGNDLVNNVFMPRGRNISVKLFQIYNRWGELVFETDMDNVGWDGTYKGEIVQEGLYIWKLFYTTPNGPYIKKSNAFGQILLIR